MKKRLLAAAAALIIFGIIWVASFLHFNKNRELIAQKAYQSGDYAKTQKTLERQQIDDPNNPNLSFNLGVANYKQNQFHNAESHFMRSADQAEKLLGNPKNSPEQQDDITKFASHSSANAGNSGFRVAQSFLKDEKKRTEAIKPLEGSAKNYQRALSHDPKDEISKKKMELIEKLIALLKQEEEQKDQEQPQDQNQQGDCNDKGDSSDQGKSDSKKDQDGKQDPQDSSQKGDNDSDSSSGGKQDKKDKQDGQGQNKDKDNQDGKQDKQDQSGNDDEQDKKDKGKDDKEEDSGGKDEIEKDNESDGKDDKSKTEAGEQDKESYEDALKKLLEQLGALQDESDEEFDKKHQAENDEQNQAPEDQAGANTAQNSNQEKGQQDFARQGDEKPMGTASLAKGESQGSDQEGKMLAPLQEGETLEERSARLLLSQLDSNEATLQKRRILMQSRNHGQRRRPGQKPW